MSTTNSLTISGLLRSLTPQDRGPQPHPEEGRSQHRQVLADALLDEEREWESRICRTDHPIAVEDGEIVGGYPSTYDTGDEVFPICWRLTNDQHLCCQCRNGLNRCPVLFAEAGPGWEIRYEVVLEGGRDLQCCHCGGVIRSKYGMDDPVELDETGMVVFASQPTQ
jgi:hypothetical protein